MEPVLQLNGKLAGIIEMRSAEGVASVLEIAGVAQVESCRRDRPLLTEQLTNRNVRLCVGIKVRRTVSIQES